MKKPFNYLLFFVVLIFVSFSFIFFACLSAPVSLQRFGNTHHYLLHQILAGLLPGIVLGIVAYKISLHWLKKWAPLIVLANIGVMFLVFLPGIGTTAGGASRWINIGIGSFQPAEFLKISAIIYLSAWIASKLSDTPVKDWKSISKRFLNNFFQVFLPFILFLGLIAIALFLQSDVSTLGIISITLLVLYFSAKTPLWHTLSIVFAGLGTLLFMIRFEPYRFDRWLIFLHPDTDPLGKGFQIRQSLISLGSGGVIGKGLGLSTQKFGFLPTAISDSIFAIIGEELGIIGCIIFIAVFIMIFWLGIRIAKHSNDRFSKMLAIGIVFWITFQAFINISSAIGIFPLAGIPLPFFSYGGSHLVVELIGIGLLLNISKNT